MPTLHLLGTGGVVTGPGRTTVMLAFTHGGSTLVVDCGGDVVHRLLACGIDPETVDALIVTHEHPDHVNGLPLLLEKVWLAGRERPLPIYGIEPALAQAKRLIDAYPHGGWKQKPPLEWHTVAQEQGAPVLETERWRVTAAPGTHSVPVIGVRVEDPAGGGSVAYSCDTERSDAVSRLARGATVLVHEAGGGGNGHTSAEDAARVAHEARVDRLVLVHLPDELPDLSPALGIFADTEFGEDSGRYEF
jgi:ribonuclease Z